MGGIILTVHITLMLILNERVTSGFGNVRVVDDQDLLDCSVTLEFTAQFGFRCVVVLEKKNMI